jgi:purine-binding chemotaxis protein CheW
MSKTHGQQRLAEEDGADAPDLNAQIEQFVTFTIGEEEYGVDIMEVREIKGWTHATRLPNSPHHVRGVINLRGIMVPVFDLRARFNEGLTTPTKTHVVVIVAVVGRVLGILVDTVSDILSISRAQIKPVPRTDRATDADFLSGLVTIEGRTVALLTLDRLFDLDRAALDGTTPAATQTFASTLAPAFEPAA